jgi:hypothetical protein
MDVLAVGADGSQPQQLLWTLKVIVDQTGGDAQLNADGAKFDCSWTACGKVLTRSDDESLARSPRGCPVDYWCHGSALRLSATIAALRHFSVTASKTRERLQSSA